MAFFFFFWFKFGILYEHQTFTLHWTNERSLRKIPAIRWTKDRQMDKNSILNYLGLRPVLARV
jgi:hypothetical protein